MDSLPFEPIPVGVTVKPLSFKKIWRYLTAGEVIPCLSVVVKTYDCGNREVVVVVVLAHLDVVVDNEFTFVNVVEFR